MRKVFFVFCVVFGIGLFFCLFTFFKKEGKTEVGNQNVCLPLDQWLESFSTYQDEDYARFRDKRRLAWYQSILPWLEWNEEHHQRERNSAFLLLSEQEQKKKLQFPSLTTIEKDYNAFLKEQGNPYCKNYFTGDCLATHYDDIVNFIAHNPSLYDPEKTPPQVDISDLDHQFFLYLRQAVPNLMLDPREWERITEEGKFIENWRQLVKFRIFREEEFRRQYLVVKLQGKEFEIGF